MEQHFDPRFYYYYSFTALKECLSWAFELPRPFLFLLALDPQERIVFSTSFSCYRFMKDGMPAWKAPWGASTTFMQMGTTGRGEHLVYGHTAGQLSPSPPSIGMVGSSGSETARLLEVTQGQDLGYPLIFRALSEQVFGG